MARAVTTVITCDLCSQTDTQKEANNTYAFKYAGTSYEIDLCEEHGNRFETDLAGWISMARRVDLGGARRGRRAMTSSNGQGQGRNLKDVREWAKNNGYTLGDRGRLPREVLDAYDKANSTKIAS